ncbi:MFS transporter [Hymenobacter crusticola]|uniref:Lysosomal dipeptide transporter MFSD1 n=1 Tax=Hymenobacter crusticola TaxID=1770526 RepID=A0A243WJE6_9BACT|nr:MFS transporter [Hymenobacter crusticola]OUJ75410.1 MFS transporter [Hymenobacter crusticola]
MLVPSSSARTRPYVIAWVFSLIFYFLEYAVRSGPAVMLPELAGVFGVSTTEVSGILGTYYYTYSLAGLIAGIALDRTGAKYALPAGVAIVALGCALFAVPGPLAGNAGRLLQGAGSAFAFTGSVYLASRGFQAKSLATAIGATQCLGMLGGALGQSVAGPLIHNGFDLRTFWVLMGAANLATCLALFFITPNDAAEQAQQPNAKASLLEPYKIVFRNPQSYLCGLIAGLLFAPTTIFAMNWGVASLQQDQQMSYAAAAWACSMVPLGWVVGCPLLGWAADRLGRRKPVLFGGAASMMLLGLQQLYLPSLLPLYVSLFLFGVASGAAMIPYSIIKEANPDEVKGSATGAMNFLTFGVSAVLGPLFARLYGQTLGNAADPAAHFQTGGLFWIGCTSVAIVAALLLRETGAGRKTTVSGADARFSPGGTRIAPLRG